MFKEKNSGITVVNEDTLFFVSFSSATFKIEHSVLLTEFLEDETEFSNVPASVMNRDNQLLIVPDYWFGQTNLSLQTQKHSIVEPFIERNLASEHPDLQDIGLFYGYSFDTDRSEEKNINVFFFLDPLSYRLYQKLDRIGIAPYDITIPAYIWEKKLAKGYPESKGTGVGLIQKLATASYLYFYHRGQFLFSRNIQSSDMLGDDADVLNALTYEINQSVYLFSQKKKADLEQIIIDSARREDAAELAESLGRDVQPLLQGHSADAAHQELSATLGPVGMFEPKDLAASKKYLAIAQKDHAKAREWRPVQMAGVLVGILLFLILGAEYFFLVKWSKQDPGSTVAGIMANRSTSEVIAQYNESLDLILEETRKPSSWATMVDVAKSLPSNVRIKQMKLDIGDVPIVNLRCIVRAEHMADFRQTLTLLLERIGNSFIGGRALEPQDVELGEIIRGKDYIDFPIQFEFRV